MLPTTHKRTSFDVVGAELLAEAYTFHEADLKTRPHDFSSGPRRRSQQAIVLSSAGSTLLGDLFQTVDRRFLLVAQRLSSRAA